MSNIRVRRLDKIIRERHQSQTENFEFTKMRRRADFQTLILDTLVLTGAIATMLVAPNALKVFKPLIKKNRMRDRTNRALQGLSKNGYIQFTEKDSCQTVALTQKGQKFMEFLATERATEKKRTKQKRSSAT